MDRRSLLVATLTAPLAWACERTPPPAAPAPSVRTPTGMKEPNTGLEFPSPTLFNSVAYDIVHTSTLNTRVMGIATYSAAVGYYVENGRWRASEDAKRQLLDGPFNKLLVIGFVRPTPTSALRELFWDQVNARMPDAFEPRNEADLRAIINGFADQKRGDAMQFVWYATGELELLVDRTTRARIANPALARAIWSLFLP